MTGGERKNEHESKGASYSGNSDSSKCSRSSVSMGYSKSIANQFYRRIRELFSDISTVLSFPMKLALFGFQVTGGLLLAIGYGIMNNWGCYTPLLLVIGFSPELFLVAREVYRQIHSLPPSEAFETSPERWSKAFQEYADSQKKH